MSRWLARFSFSFMILAVFLGYEGYRRLGTSADKLRVGLYFTAAGLSFGLGVRGLRERHKKEHD